MDAVEFIKERMRMCNTYDELLCCGCPAQDMLDCAIRTEDPEKLVKIVEQWSKEHPKKTIMQDFFEKFPNAPRKENGTPLICPKYVGYPKPKESCEDCINKFVQCWSRPMEE